MARMAVIPRAPAPIALPRYDDMCRAIAECHRVNEAKSIRDKTEALRAWAKQANNRELEVQFAEIKVRAEIRCGELLLEMAELGERDKGGRGPIVESQRATQLADLGLDKHETSRFQQIAQAPGASRMSVLRQIIGEWVEHETHRASLVMRVRGGNGNAPESDRNRAGSAAGGRR